MKNYLMEFLGTFFLTLSIAIVSGNALAIGLMLIALVYIGGHVSGAHYNPALVIAGWRQGHHDTQEAISYIVAEIAGSLLALLFVFYSFRIVFIHPMATEVHPWVVVAFEVMLAFVFAWVYLNVRQHKVEQHIAGLALGFTLAALAFLGGLFNPAVALGSMILDSFTGGSIDKTGIWYVIVYVVGPLFGGALAEYAHSYFNKK